MLHQRLTQRTYGPTTSAPVRWQPPRTTPTDHLSRKKHLRATTHGAGDVTIRDTTPPEIAAQRPVLRNKWGATITASAHARNTEHTHGTPTTRTPDAFHTIA
jgi:hypothetical protein